MMTTNLDSKEERPHSSLHYRTPAEFAALMSAKQKVFYVADAGQEASIASPLPRTLNLS